MLWFSVHNVYPSISVFLSPCSLIIILSNSHSQVRCESQTVYSTHHSVYPTRHCLNSTLMAINEDEDLMCLSIKKLNTIQYRHSNSSASSLSLQCAFISTFLPDAMDWCGPEQLSRYSESLRAGRSGDRVPVRERFSAPVQTGHGAYPASYTMGTGSFPGLKRTGRGVDHPPHVESRLKKRVDLYFYSPSEPSWPVLEWTVYVMDCHRTLQYKISVLQLRLLKSGQTCMSLHGLLLLTVFNTNAEESGVWKFENQMIYKQY